MIRTLYISIVLLLSMQSNAQQFLNGSFENHIATNCKVICFFNQQPDNPFINNNGEGDMHIIFHWENFIQWHPEMWLFPGNCDSISPGSYGEGGVDGLWFV